MSVPVETKRKKVKIPSFIEDDTGDFTDQCKAALEEIFCRYDLDKDGCLNDKELDDFAVICNGSPFDTNSKKEIQVHFNVNEHGHLTLEGFLEMYHTQTSAEPEETWRDLQAQGYDSSLQLQPKK